MLKTEKETETERRKVYRVKELEKSESKIEHEDLLTAEHSGEAPKTHL